MRDRYCCLETGSISVYYPATLVTRPGYAAVRIKLKKFLFFKWLEIEGAKALVLYH
ncbi:hypothetical protein [Sporomusa termitida]|uniref:hypothetical protein n=1 Tax=Sporomusa termitida TaxID=2377 RepID=UPI0014793B79|nr:hypothetical protein [Sporomusa termitida]